MTFNKILRGLIITGIFSLFVIPFLVPSSMFFPFITGKGFAFRVIVEIIFAAWVILAFRDPAVRPRKSSLLWSFIAFVVVLALADAFGVNPWKSFWSNFERMEGYITTIHLFLYFLVASTVLASERIWKRWLEWSVWSSVLVSIYSLFQLAGRIPINQGGVRVDATFGNATYLAIFMVFNIFFALILIAHDREEPEPSDRHLWKPIVYGAIALLDAAILYYTATRGSILGLIGGILLAALIIAIFDKRERRLRIVAATAIGIVAVVVLGFIAIRNTPFVTKSPTLDRFASISWNGGGGEARVYIWPMAIKGWEERPILGWGQENFNYIFNRDYDPRMWSQEQWFDHAHNEVLDWLFTGGILGLAAYLALFVSALWLLWKKTDMTFSAKSLVTGLLAAYFFHNLFVFDNIDSYVLFFSVLAMIGWRSTRLEKPITAEDEASEDDMRMIVPVVLVALAFSLYFFNYRGYMTNVDLLGALQATNSGDAQTALSDFQAALSYDTLGRPEVVERIVEAVPAMNASSVPIGVRQSFAEMAKTAVDGQVAWFKGDARYEVFAGTFYAEYGDGVDAEKHYLAAIALSPKKQSIMLQLAELYISEQQYDKAAAIAKQAYDLAHDDTQAAETYAAALVYGGHTKEAQAVLSEANDTAPGDTLLQAYIAKSEWSSVISILKARIASNPADLTSLQNLAIAYYRSGDRADAISTIQAIEALNPAFKSQGDQMIKDIQAGK